VRDIQIKKFMRIEMSSQLVSIENFDENHLKFNA